MSEFYLIKEEIDALNELDKEVYFKSHYSFISGHNGHRPGKMHVYMGTAGGGKSTLIRSILIDLLDCNPDMGKICLWLSEENVTDFQKDFYRSGYQSEDAKKVMAYSEFDFNGKTKTIHDWFSLLEETLCAPDIDFLILDNLTTSQMYMSASPQDQSCIILKIKNLIANLGIPAIIVMHTGSEINENMPRLIGMNDIRGAKTIVNLAEFFYIMQRFQSKEEYFSTIRITKHRGQDASNGIFFLLSYHKKLRIYFSATKLDFEEFKAAFKQRNTL